MLHLHEGPDKGCTTGGIEKRKKPCNWRDLVTTKEKTEKAQEEIELK